MDEFDIFLVIGLGSVIMQFDDHILLIFFTSTVLFNAYTTVAIAYRSFPLLRHERDAKMIEARAGSSIILLLENGALYTLVGLIFLALTNRGTNIMVVSIFRLVLQVMPVRKSLAKIIHICDSVA
jgi:hypothetical protein